MKELHITPFEKETIYTTENMIKALDHIESYIPGFEDLIKKPLDDAISVFIDEMLENFDVTLECMGMNDSQTKQIYDMVDTRDIICYIGDIGSDFNKERVTKAIKMVYNGEKPVYYSEEAKNIFTLEVLKKLYDENNNNEESFEEYFGGTEDETRIVMLFFEYDRFLSELEHAGVPEGKMFDLMDEYNIKPEEVACYYYNLGRKETRDKVKNVYNLAMSLV